MKLQYLGTAAAEGIPALFCKCDYCQKARATGGKSIRTRSQALVDDRILIDFNADSYMHSLKYNIALSDIRSLLITHVHSDHFYPDDLESRLPVFAHIDNCEQMTVYGSKDIKEPLKNYVRDDEHYGIAVKTVEPFKPFIIEDEYEITALKANHGTDNPYLYIIKNGDKTMLYAHDTGFLPDESYDYLLKSHIVFDFISIDCNEPGNNSEYPYHMTYKKCKKLISDFKNDGIANDNTIICLNHFSHNGKYCLYDELSEIAAESGFIVSYDGMTVEF